MIYKTLISTENLAKHLGEDDWAIFDCRFSLSDSNLGRKDYLAAHIPGAVYVHLDEDLCGPILPGQTGRHPLPPEAVIVQSFSNWGIGNGVQMVVYDDTGGSMAARLWWMARWLGHDSVAVLDGGWPSWKAEGRPVQTEIKSRPARPFIPQPHADRIADSGEIFTRLGDSSLRLIDSRIPERFRGEIEPIDAIAGRIPGALNAPHLENIGPDGLFLPPSQLRSRFEPLLHGIPAKEAIFYCGSGVTAARNLLAMAHAGLGDARLYAGSWSEWITNDNHPIEKD